LYSQLHRFGALTLLAIAVASVALARPLLRQPPIYLIEGYLDRAPEKTKVIDRVDITAPGKKTRWLLVTSYRAPSDILLSRYLSQELKHPWVVGGKEEYVARLLDAAEGAQVAGKFVIYRTGSPWLMIAELDQPAPQ
jgi:hypothetical protein